MSLELDIKQPKFTSIYQKTAVNIFFTSGWLESQQSEILKPYGLSIQQYNILRILRGQYPNPARVSLLIERMMDKMSNASRLVDKLLAKGLATRSLCNDDRRAVDIVLTTKGITVLEQLDLKQIEWEKMLQKQLTDQEATLLNSLLDKLRHHSSESDTI